MKTLIDLWLYMTAGTSTNCNINQHLFMRDKKTVNITSHGTIHHLETIWRLFLKLIKEEFPLHPIFNKNTLKVSYCSMKSVKDIINSHNHKLLANKEQHSAQDQLTKLCNCRSKTDCPLQGKCLLSAIIYQAKVSTQVGEESYIGLTETSFTTTTKPHLHIKKRENQQN